MTTSELGRAWFERLWIERDPSAIDELADEKIRLDLGFAKLTGRDEVKRVWNETLSAFPDLRIEVLSAVGEGDFGSVRWRVTGTHLGPGLGMVPQGDRIDFCGRCVYEVRNGKIVEARDEWDMETVLGKLKQTPFLS